MSFLKQLQRMITNEWNATSYYRDLLTKTNHSMHHELIQQVVIDEEKHYNLFQYVHYLLAGYYYEPFSKQRSSRDLSNGLQMALEEKLTIATRYEEMLSDLTHRHATYPLLVALNDEKKHCSTISTVLQELTN